MACVAADILAPYLDANCLPGAFLFDLDFTCWPFWLDSYTDGPPFRQHADGVTVVDSHGTRVEMNSHVPEILCALHKAKMPIVLCSRSDAPEWCYEVIRLYVLDPGHMPPLRFQDVIHPASVVRPARSKVQHLKEIQFALQIPFERLLFFDDEERICEEARGMGVRCVNVGKESGVTRDMFEHGLRLFLPKSKC